MRYWFDTEFIENGQTIDLISIGIVAEDDRELYLQNSKCDFNQANDWVARNVLPHLSDFDMGTRNRSCVSFDSPRISSGEVGKCSRDDCAWRSRSSLGSAIRVFCDPEKYGKPEFWGYFADYDWVVLCQLFGSMTRLPEGWPMYCRDLKQWCDQLGNPLLPEQGNGEHHALADARWNRQVFDFLGRRADGD